MKCWACGHKIRFWQVALQVKSDKAVHSKCLYIAFNKLDQ